MNCEVAPLSLSQTLTLTPDDALEVRIDLMDFLRKIIRGKENLENRESKVKKALKNPSNFSPLQTSRDSILRFPKLYSFG